MRCRVYCCCGFSSATKTLNRTPKPLKALSLKPLDSLKGSFQGSITVLQGSIIKGTIGFKV